MIRTISAWCCIALVGGAVGLSALLAPRAISAERLMSLRASAATPPVHIRPECSWCAPEKGRTCMPDDQVGCDPQPWLIPQITAGGQTFNNYNTGLFTQCAKPDGSECTGDPLQRMMDRRANDDCALAGVTDCDTGTSDYCCERPLGGCKTDGKVATFTITVGAVTYTFTGYQGKKCWCQPPSNNARAVSYTRWNCIVKP